MEIERGVIDSVTVAETNVAVMVTPVGRGVMTARPFEEGTIIGTLTGPVVCDASYESDYCIRLTDTLSLEVAPPYRYLNHSCEPNCELVHYEGERDDEHEICLTATRQIVDGAELTIDYAWPSGKEIPCECGVERCRGWIVDEDELHLVC